MELSISMNGNVYYRCIECCNPVSIMPDGRAVCTHCLHEEKIPNIEWFVNRHNKVQHFFSELPEEMNKICTSYCWTVKNDVTKNLILEAVDCLMTSYKEMGNILEFKVDMVDGYPEGTYIKCTFTIPEVIFKEFKMSFLIS